MRVLAGGEEQKERATAWPRRGLRFLSALSGRVGRRVVGFLWPPVCIHCQTATADAHALCPRCWAALGLIERPFCERSGVPFAIDIGGPLLSPEVIARPPAYQRARAVARYDDVAQALVHRLKYGDRLELATALGRMMARAGSDLTAEADAIVPIPLHRLRFIKRRFNQAALLAETVGRESGVPVAHDLLVRRKHTPPQVGLTRAERAANVTGAFRVPPEQRPRLAGKRLLLVDDVTTTGATINAAANVLLRAGAGAVDALVFARVVHDG